MEQSAKQYKVIHEMGDGLLIALVGLESLKEQDINARIMSNEMQGQLTANISKRKQLESLPFVALVDGKLEIISGHHRIKSARQAGLKEVYVILDVSGLNRSQIAAKQLAHNAISGFDDQGTIKEIIKMISDVDDLLESYIGKDVLQEPSADFDKMLSPAVDFDFRNIVFSFLPHQFANFEALVKHLAQTKTDIVGVAPIEVYESFVETLLKYQQFQGIRNIGAAINAMADAAREKLEVAGYDDEGEWTHLSKLFGGNSVPSEAAEVIKDALKKAEKDGVIGKKNKWQLIEYLAADYLAGG